MTERDHDLEIDWEARAAEVMDCAAHAGSLLEGAGGAMRCAKLRRLLLKEHHPIAAKLAMAWMQMRGLAHTRGRGKRQEWALHPDMPQLEGLSTDDYEVTHTAGGVCVKVDRPGRATKTHYIDRPNAQADGQA